MKETNQIKNIVVVNNEYVIVVFNDGTQQELNVRTFTVKDGMKIYS